MSETYGNQQWIWAVPSVIYDVVYADKSKLSTSKIVAIAAPISASVVLFIVGCCFLIRRGKKYNSVDGENGNE